MYAREYSLIELAESLKPDADHRKGRFERSISGMVLDLLPRAHARVGAAIPGRKFARDLEVGTSTAGGDLVGKNVLRVAEAARPVTVLEEAGIRHTTVNSTGQVQLPIFDGNLSTSTWIDEGAPSPSFTALQVKVATLTGKQCSSRIAYSRRVAVGVPDRSSFEAALLAELQAAVKTQIETGLLFGTGSSGQPLGIANSPSKTTITFAAATPTFTELSAMLATYADLDGDLANAHLFVHPSDLVAAMNTTAVTGGGRTAVEYVNQTYRLSGVPVHATTSVTEGKFILTDVSRINVVYFGPATIIIDPFSNGKSIMGQTEVHLHNFVDIAVNDSSLVVVGSS